jgi:hypothetical protein
MEESHREDERLIFSKMEEIDKKYMSPEERAREIYNILRKAAPNLTNWDLLCFCAEYTAFMAVANEWLKPYAGPLARTIYTAHYLAGEEFLERINAGNRALRESDPPDAASKGGDENLSDGDQRATQDDGSTKDRDETIRDGVHGGGSSVEGQDGGTEEAK